MQIESNVCEKGLKVVVKIDARTLKLAINSEDQADHLAVRVSDRVESFMADYLYSPEGVEEIRAL